MSLLEIRLGRPKKFWHCVVPGEAMAWQRAGRSTHYYNRSKKDQDAFAWQVKAACPDMRSDLGEKIWGVRFRFYTTCGAFNVGDWDNLAKNICDALQRVVWENDSQICEGFVQKIPSNEARTELVIYPISEDYLASQGELL